LTCFVDTNVLLYTREQHATVKSERATAWLTALGAHERLVLSRQSLNEFYNRLTRKFHWVPVAEARAAYLALERYATAPFDRDCVIKAWQLQDRYRTGFFDGVLLASGLSAGCRYFLTEDLQDGQRIEGIRIINPFTTPIDLVIGAH